MKYHIVGYFKCDIADSVGKGIGWYVYHDSLTVEGPLYGPYKTRGAARAAVHMLKVCLTKMEKHFEQNNADKEV